MDVAKKFKENGFKFLVVKGKCGDVVKRLGEDAGCIVSDYNYLRWGREVREDVGKGVGVKMVIVEGDVVVPVRVTSEKKEYAARTIRPKIHKVMDEYLGRDELVEIEDCGGGGDGGDVEVGLEGLEVLDLEKGWEEVQRGLEVDRGSGVVKGGFKGGEVEAEGVLGEFLENKLKAYADERNEPAKDMQSDLSPYLRFGNLSPVYVVRKALEAAKKKSKTGVDSFVEELVVRRELAINFVFYARDSYDSYKVLPDFAKKTLKDHEGDKRTYVYSYEELEAGVTHDEYWNAAQLEMVVRGKMQGYMRMYWAKKILEWTAKPETAMSYALRLNNRWELDGEDANSYAGVMWCFGLHDHGWTERDIFGKVRFMNQSGLKRKFNMQGYAAKVQELIKKYGLPSELEELQKKKNRGQKRIPDLFGSENTKAKKKVKKG